MGRPRKNPNPGDSEQTASGADVNALRNNFQIGEEKALVIKNVHQGAEAGADDYVISAEVSEGDADTDNVKNMTPEYTPKQGDTWRFKRTEEGMEMYGVSVAPTGEAPNAASEPPADAPAAEPPTDAPADTASNA